MHEFSYILISGCKSFKKNLISITKKSKQCLPRFCILKKRNQKEFDDCLAHKDFYVPFMQLHERMV